jgi:hypothetical protein
MLLGETTDLRSHENRAFEANIREWQHQGLLMYWFGVFAHSSSRWARLVRSHTLIAILIAIETRKMEDG